MSSVQHRVRGLVGPTGTINRPDALYCSTTGSRLGPAGAAEMGSGNRSAVGVVVFDDGTTVSLHGDAVIGRMPHTYGGFDAVPVDDPSHTVSRVHLLLRIEGWNVHATDLCSSNGTHRRARDRSWDRLMPGEPYELATNCELRLGDRTLKFHQLGR